jgi:hypothetical protein
MGWMAGFQDACLQPYFEILLMKLCCHELAILWLACIIRKIGLHNFALACLGVVRNEIPTVALWPNG